MYHGKDILTRRKSVDLLIASKRRLNHSQHNLGSRLVVVEKEVTTRGGGFLEESLVPARIKRLRRGNEKRFPLNDAQRKTSITEGRGDKEKQGGKKRGGETISATIAAQCGYLVVYLLLLRAGVRTEPGEGVMGKRK